MPSRSQKPLPIWRPSSPNNFRVAVVSNISLNNELQLALRIADAADAVSLAGFNSRSFSVMRKADKSEVTEIDRATETAITNILRAERPEHSVYGEEHGIIGPSDAKFQWVIDPIDGTVNFANGIPICCVSIGIEQDGEMKTIESALALRLLNKLKDKGVNIFS